MAQRQRASVSRLLRFPVYGRASSLRGITATTHKGSEALDQFPTVGNTLEKRRGNEQVPHVVFLEGGKGTGKNDLIWRLKKIGYQACSFPFIPFSLSHQTISPLSTNSHLLHTAWFRQLIDYLDQQQERKEKGEGDLKDNLVFVARSPLTSYIHFSVLGKAKQESLFYRALLSEMKTTYNASVVVCKSDFVRSRERLAERHLLASPEEQRLREELGETDPDRLQDVLNAYEEEERREDTVIDASIYTTSTKQGTAHLLKVLGVRMDWVWEDLKKRHNIQS